MNEIDVFTTHYSKLCNTLTDIDRLLPYLVDENVITDEDLEEIIATVPSTKLKVQKLMPHISGPLRAGNTEGFHIMLSIMEKYGHQATKQLADQIRRSLNMSFERITGSHDQENANAFTQATLFPVLYSLSAHQPPFVHCFGHLQYNNSTQYSLPQQTAKYMHMSSNSSSMEELEHTKNRSLQVNQQYEESITMLPPSPTRSHKMSSALLIGSGACVVIDAVSPRRPLDIQSKAPLDGVLKDLERMNSFLNDRNITVHKVMLGNRQNKSDYLNAFKDFFSQQSMRRFVIYYSGPGSTGKFSTNRGDWCLETSGEKEITYIGLLDILQLWNEMRSQCGADSYELKDQFLLFIIADSCYSGSWVEEIKNKYPYKVTPSGEKYRDVHMIASCQSHELCYYSISYGGDFTGHYITADSSRHNLQDSAAHIVKLTAQSVFQTITFPLYMPIKGLANYYNSTSHLHTPVATNETEHYRPLLMKYDGEILPIGRGLGIASGWSWMLSGQIFHN